jgi:putative protein-disulfide isomerase
MKLIFVGDPMCSWCYGFGKEMTALMALHPDLPLEIIVGGLRAGATDVLDTRGKQFRLGHWARVEESSGLPFNRDALMARENFVYDTEPICRAVVTARRLSPEVDLLAVFRALQHAFYVDGLDTTDGVVLAQAAVAAMAKSGHTHSVSAFHDEWAAPDTVAAASREFALARQMGIQSFPALLLEANGQLIEISPGYASVAQLEQRLSAVLGSQAAAA